MSNTLSSEDEFKTPLGMPVLPNIEIICRDELGLDGVAQRRLQATTKDFRDAWEDEQGIDLASKEMELAAPVMINDIAKLYLEEGWEGGPGVRRISPGKYLWGSAEDESGGSWLRYPADKNKILTGIERIFAKQQQYRKSKRKNKNQTSDGEVDDDYAPNKAAELPDIDSLLQKKLRSPPSSEIKGKPTQEQSQQMRHDTALPFSVSDVVDDRPVFPQVRAPTAIMTGVLAPEEGSSHSKHELKEKPRSEQHDAGAWTGLTAAPGIQDNRPSHIDEDDGPEASELHSIIDESLSQLDTVDGDIGNRKSEAKSGSHSGRGRSAKASKRPKHRRESSSPSTFVQGSAGQSGEEENELDRRKPAKRRKVVEEPIMVEAMQPMPEHSVADLPGGRVLRGFVARKPPSSVNNQPTGSPYNPRSGSTPQITQHLITSTEPGSPTFATSSPRLQLEEPSNDLTFNKIGGSRAVSIDSVMGGMQGAAGTGDFPTEQRQATKPEESPVQKSQLPPASPSPAPVIQFWILASTTPRLVWRQWAGATLNTLSVDSIYEAVMKQSGLSSFHKINMSLQTAEQEWTFDISRQNGEHFVHMKRFMAATVKGTMLRSRDDDAEMTFCVYLTPVVGEKDN